MATDISYQTYGEGPEVVLLHGFPMKSGVWNDFAQRLARNFKVYTPDLPGFGRSPLTEADFSLATIALKLCEWIASARISKPVLIGHSMGGYVALEMIKLDPRSFTGLCLFHSTAKDDPAEKKESRTKVIKFVKDNGVEAFTSNFIQPLFVDQNHPAISIVRAITMQATDRAVIGYTKAMRDRNDNTGVLRDFARPVLVIGGDQDKGIPVESLREQAIANPNIELHILKQVGHMGMFESPEEAGGLVEGFLSKIYNPAGVR